MNLLEVDRLNLHIGKQTLCHQLSLSITAGERLAILGPNGSGKTTLLHTLAGIRQADSGSIQLLGKPLASYPPRQRARHIGLLLQQQSSPFPGTVREHCLLGRHPHLPRWQDESAADRTLAAQALQTVALDTLADRNLTTLSGGERQRLAIATLLTQDSPIMMLDEPSNHLDLHHQVSLLQYLTDHHRQHDKAVIMILHDINLAARFCDRFLLLFGDGETLIGTHQTALTEAHLSRLYHHPIRHIHDQGTSLYIPA